MIVPVLSHAKPFPSGRLQTHTGTHGPSTTEPGPYQKPLCTKKHPQVSLPSSDTHTGHMQTHTQAHGHVSFDRDMFTLSTHRHTILHTHTHTHTHHSHSGVHTATVPRGTMLPSSYTSCNKPQQQLRGQDGWLQKLLLQTPGLGLWTPQDKDQGAATSLCTGLLGDP